MAEIHLFVMLVLLVFGWVQEVSVARGSFVFSASIVGLWLGTGGGLWQRFICCNASIVGLWLGTGVGLWP